MIFGKRVFLLWQLKYLKTVAKTRWVNLSGIQITAVICYVKLSMGTGFQDSVLVLSLHNRILQSKEDSKMPWCELGCVSVALPYTS